MESYLLNLQSQSRQLEGYISGAKDIYETVQPFLPPELRLRIKEDFIRLAEQKYEFNVRISEIQAEILEQAKKNLERQNLEQ